MSRVAQSTLVRSLAIAIVAGVVLFLITHEVSSYRNVQIKNLALNFCAVAGLTVLIGKSGQVSLGNGAFMFVGGYSVALLLKHHSGGAQGPSNWTLALGLLVAVAASALVGGLVGIAAARLRGPYLAGVTLALALGLPALPTYQHLQGKLGGHSGLDYSLPNAPGNMDIDRWEAWICCLCALITMFLLYNLMRSRVGRSMEAVRDDEIAASLAGLSVARVQILAFVVSAAAAGLAGGLLASIQYNVAPGSFPLSISLNLLAAAVIGGLGTLSGAAIGAVLVTFLQVWSQDLANQFSLSADVYNNIPLAFFGVALILSMLVFPYGVVGLLQRLWLRARARLSPSRAAAG